ncbi:MAG: TraR/DksA family transcriptional regulator [Acidimicrobiales bacterium]
MTSFERAEATRRAAGELEEVERRLAAVETALGRLEDGTYGSCASCGAPITDADLEADPLKELCSSCSAAAGVGAG